MDGVFELTDIAAPGMAEQQPLGLRRKRPERHAVRLGIFAGKMARKGENVLWPFAQGRQLQIHDVEPVEQILAERVALYRLRKVAVRGRDDADVDFDRLAAAHPVDLALMKRAQELGLQPRIHFADLVEQQRAAIGLLEFAEAARDGAGERALLM